MRREAPIGSVVGYAVEKVERVMTDLDGDYVVLYFADGSTLYADNPTLYTTIEKENEMPTDLKQQWTLVVEVDKGVTPDEVTTWMEEAGNIRVREVHFENLVETSDEDEDEDEMLRRGEEEIAPESIRADLEAQ